MVSLKTLVSGWLGTALLSSAPVPCIYTETSAAGPRLQIISGGAPRALVPGFAASADAAVSFDGLRVLFSGKRVAAAPWEIWEMPAAGGAPRRVSAGDQDCIRPFYLPDNQVVYGRRTPQGFQIENLSLTGGTPLRLTYGPGDHLPSDVLHDGRVLFEAKLGGARDIFSVYPDGSGVETHRCDHGRDRHAARELASGDIVFQTGARLARFTSARAVQIDIKLPAGEFAGPIAEIARGEWLVSYRPNAQASFGLYRLVGQVLSKVADNGSQPVLVRPSPAPLRFPSALGNREGANVLCLNAYTSKARIAPGAAATVRVYGEDGALGEAPVERDGSFFVKVPSEQALRFELLDRAGKVVQAERGWFWLRRGEQRVCVGCHAGAERAPDNAVPEVLLRATEPVSIPAHSAHGGSK